MLQIDDLVVKDNRGIEAVKGISLQVCNGEILGIAGVEGNGQTELVEALAGLRKPSSGHIMVRQIDATGMSPRRVRDLGVAHIPEDRQARGLILGFTVAENLVLGRHHKAPFADGSMIAEDTIVDLAKSLVSEYDIKVSEVRATADTLSGGNQQKLVVARELAPNPDIVLAAQPTRGLDVGATEFVHNTLIRMREAGAAVLLVSAELDEIRNLSDRIAVIYDGRIVAIKMPEETTPEELGLLMAGHGPDEMEVGA
ncbi:ATP-binding cassette domain-containing protein [Candidatus Thorarchaeota archaeon]|nr:MAG: ATP-binding cassette domain-containing protein [Candidatus Thorarchaeota archaeon]